MWAKLQLGEWLECSRNTSEGGSAGGKSHPACGHGAVPRAGGPVAPGMMEDQQEDELPPRNPFPLGCYCDTLVASLLPWDIGATNPC